MALNLNFGGDNEYISAATQAARQGGGTNVIASIFDMLGIHRQVAKPPEESTEGSPAKPPIPAQERAQVTTPNVEQAPEILFEPAGSVPSTAWGRQYIESLKPLTQVDPDEVFKIR